jgi:hypothetical protein
MSNLSDLIPAGGGQNNTDFVADGAIASGKPVILTAAGKAAEVDESAVSETLGAPADANDVTAKGYGVDICYDSGNDKLVTAWTRDSDIYPMVSVGTISGTTTTWGTSVVVTSGAADGQIAIEYSPDDEKVLVIYTLASDTYPYGAVGTVSGTSVSFGSPTAVTSVAAQKPKITYDTTNNQFLVLTMQGSAALLKVSIGTISGTSVSFTGTITVTSGGNAIPMGIAWDENAAAMGILYKNNSNYLYGRTGTSDGSTITLGTETEIGTWNPYGVGGITYDSTAQKCVGVWKNTSGYGAGAVITLVGGSTRSFTDATEATFNSSNVGTGERSMSCAYATPAADTTTVVFIESSDNYPRFCNGTVSGTSISFNTVARLWSDNAANSRNDICSVVSGKVGIVANPQTTIGVLTDNATTVNVLQNVADVTNLTATNLLGIAAGAILDTATGTINTWGSRNEVQSGLTIASDYYAQGDGTITTSSSGQLLGKALSATQINIKDYTG